ncbi:hypothetical protein [Rubellicoccus peritrichatus]|uniref:Uncharacterized protein n=1 Tax=Rubellicoccus peritrichatus TaxID=3080537 RepID=A0AAQ3QWL4_9BACT|nr:hypothetical protein [Puniceicoccus sp. CR14]WOO42843.1 hypothetical protein RZN69_07040 [Puniceicoccus sp. CR14]
MASKTIGRSNDVTVIDRPTFVMQMPATWKVADYQPDYDPDKLFTIDTEGQSTITLEVYETVQGQDTDDLLFNAIYVLDGPLVDTYSRSSFNKWGNLTGHGKHLKGKVMSMFPGGARIFFCQHNGRGLMVTEIYYSEDLQDVMEGFELIGKTFQFK